MARGYCIRDACKLQVVLKCFSVDTKTSNLYVKLMATIFALFVCFTLPFTASLASPFVELYVPEDQPEGSYVGNVATEADIYRRYSLDVAATLRFRVLFQSVPSESSGSGLETKQTFFSVNELTGEVTTTGRIDREEYCARAEKCTARVDIVLQPTAFFQIIRARIHILDINDNTPLFPVKNLKYALPESQNVELAMSQSTGFLLPEADDPDGPVFGVYRYVILSITADAEVSNETVTSTEIPFDVRRVHDQLRVVPTQSLDRESVPRYRFRVVALDGGEPRRSGSVEVIVTVIDVNDNSPTFASASMKARVREDSVAGTVVCRVTASDADIGLNADLRYRFTDETQRQYGDTFSVRPESGAVVVVGVLDYETRRDYGLYVTATDRAGANDATALTGMISLLVRVEDVNDNAPNIAFNLRQRTSIINQESDFQRRFGFSDQPFPAIEIDSTAHVGSFIAHVTVGDMDDGENGKFRCVMLSPSENENRYNNDAVSISNRFALRQLYETEYMIVTTDRLVDKSSKHNTATLSIYCADGGRPTLTSEASVLLKIVDRVANAENHHTDALSTTVIAVSEDAAIGTVLYCPRPSDKHVNPASSTVYRITDALSYSASGSTDLRFLEVNSVTGVVRTKAPLDRKLHCSIDIHLWMDIAENRTSQTLAQLSIVVVNMTRQRNLVDDRTILENPDVLYEFLVSENSARGTHVGAVAASDLCMPTSNEIEFVYKLIGKDSDALSKLFHLGVTDGRLTTRLPLDRELRSNYSMLALVSFSTEFVVSASASCQPSARQSTTVQALARLRIIISDVNDNTPIFQFPRPGNDVMTVWPEAAPGHVVSRISARDRDAGNNARVSYEIDSRSAWSKAFTIDSATGAINIGSSFDRIRFPSSPFPLYVVATDAGSPPLSTVAVLRVTVQTGNETAPADLGWLLTSSLASDRLATVLAVLLVGVLLTIAVVILSTFILVHQRCHYLDKLYSFRCSAFCGGNRKLDRSETDIGWITRCCCGYCCWCSDNNRQRHKTASTTDVAATTTAVKEADSFQNRCGRIVRPLMTVVRGVKSRGDKHDTSVTSDYGSEYDANSESNRSRRINHNHSVLDLTKSIKSTCAEVEASTTSQQSVYSEIQQQHVNADNVMTAESHQTVVSLSQRDQTHYQTVTSSPLHNTPSINVTSPAVFCAEQGTGCDSPPAHDIIIKKLDAAEHCRRLPQQITRRMPSTAGTGSPNNWFSGTRQPVIKQLSAGNYWATVAGVSCALPVPSDHCRHNGLASMQPSVQACHDCDANGNV